MAGELLNAADAVRLETVDDIASLSSDSDNCLAARPYGTKQLERECRRVGKLDEQLGLSKQKVRNIYSKNKVFTFLWIFMRATLNVTEATICLFFKLPALLSYDDANATNATSIEQEVLGTILSKTGIDTDTEFQQALEYEEYDFLRRHRFYWVSGVAWIEFIALAGFILVWLANVFNYMRGRFARVNPGVLIDNLRRTANFSVLQFAMYTSPDILQQEFGRGQQHAILNLGCSKGNVGWALNKCILAAAWMCFQCLGFVAFITKLSFEVGNIIFVDLGDWTPSHFLSFLAFVNSTVGIVEVDRLTRDRIKLFRFAGNNAAWSARELAVCFKHESVLTKVAQATLQSKCKVIIFMSTLDAKGFQYLFLQEELDPDGAEEEDPDGEIPPEWSLVDEPSDVESSDDRQSREINIIS